MAEEPRVFRPVLKAFAPSLGICIPVSLILVLPLIAISFAPGMTFIARTGIAVLLLAMIALPSYIVFRVMQELRNTRYEAREDGIVIHRQILTPSDTLLLWNQIQEVEEKAGIFDRIVGVKALLVSTMSAQSQTSGVIGNLQEAQADELKEIISHKTAKAHAPVARAAKSGVAPKYAESAATWTGGEVPYQINAGNGAIAMLFQTAPFALILMLFASDSAIFYLVIFLGVVAFQAGALYYTRYSLSRDGIEIRSEFIIKSGLRMSYSKIQFVAVRYGWADRLFGIAATVFETGEFAVQKGGNEKNKVSKAVPALSLKDALELQERVLDSMGFANTPGKEPLVSKYPLEPGAKIAFAAGSAAGLAFVAGFGIAIVFAMGASTAGLAWLAAAPIMAAVFCLLMAASYIYASAYVENFSFDDCGGALKVSSGVFGKDLLLIPYQRIQNVFVDQTLIGRALGLYNVKVSTAGEATGATASVFGLSNASAQAVRDLLLAKMKQSR